MRSRSEVKSITAIGFLDPQNIPLDTEIIALRCIVTKLDSKLTFFVMAERSDGNAPTDFFVPPDMYYHLQKNW